MKTLLRAALAALLMAGLSVTADAQFYTGLNYSVDQVIENDVAGIGAVSTTIYPAAPNGVSTDEVRVNAYSGDPNGTTEVYVKFKRNFQYTYQGPNPPPQPPALVVKPSAAIGGNISQSPPFAVPFAASMASSATGQISHAINTIPPMSSSNSYTRIPNPLWASYSPATTTTYMFLQALADGYTAGASASGKMEDTN